jgi:hypothetical protein
MRDRLIRVTVLAFGLGLFVHRVLDADGARILIMEGGKHRLLLVDRASKGTLAENSDFQRVDCLTRLSGDEFIVCDGSSFVRVGADLKERSRTPMGFERVGSISAAGGSRLLVSDTSRHTVEEIDAVGNRLWSIDVHFPSGAVRLANGNTVVADGTTVLKEFDSSGRMVRRATLARWAASLDRLTSGETLVGESLSYERLDKAGRSMWFRASKSRVTCIQELPAGEIFLCEPDSHRVAIVDAEGQVIWQYANLDYPWRAIHLM